ncbi:MAG TPA: YceI family protein [Gaiellaceae bacterium]|nr:YceI family protein [Gaiellaceae bacterium]
MSILAESPVAVLPEGTWAIDPAHSTVEFLVQHMGLATVRGRAPVVTGTITGGAQPAIEGTVSVAHLTTHDEGRDAHLRSPEFFDAERYPEIRFASTSVEAHGDEVVVVGDLEIKGVAHPVELRGRFLGQAVDPWGNDRIGVELSTVVDRAKWGLTWNAPLPDGGLLLPDDVELHASFSAVRTG